MELHSKIYYKHPNPNLMLKLDELFKEHRGDQDKFMTSTVEINPEMGHELAEDLLNTVDNVEFDLGPESISRIDGYSIAHFVHGSSGDEFVEAIVLFLKSLLDEIDVRAWGCGDDNPWEFWFKFEEDELIREDDEPFNDPEEDEEIKSSIYTWWHAGLPEKIKEGFFKSRIEAVLI